MGIEIKYPLGYASSGDTLIRDTGRLQVNFHPSYILSRMAERQVHTCMYLSFQSVEMTASGRLDRQQLR